MPRVVHFEIPASDPEQLVAFYSGVFDWQFQKWDGPEPYWLITTGKEGPGIDGGLMRRRDPAQPVVNTIDVPNVDDYAQKVEQAGGTIVVPKMAIPGMGWLVYFKDPDGNITGIFQNDAAAA
jgi:uncharacterized protein